MGTGNRLTPPPPPLSWQREMRNAESEEPKCLLELSRLLLLWLVLLFRLFRSPVDGSTGADDDDEDRPSFLARVVVT